MLFTLISPGVQKKCLHSGNEHHVSAQTAQAPNLKSLSRLSNPEAPITGQTPQHALNNLSPDRRSKWTIPSPPCSWTQVSLSVRCKKNDHMIVVVISSQLPRCMPCLLRNGTRIEQKLHHLGVTVYRRKEQSLVDRVRSIGAAPLQQPTHVLGVTIKSGVNQSSPPVRVHGLH
mmetsp:Transcript_64024/g.169557  ORF Transcript_64024/g.169557 Transcript_64024/m.169557 type:complete len:173 (-) Transcript_64024:1775-2293(-)